MKDPLELAMAAVPEAMGWFSVGRLGTARVLASRPTTGRWILCWDMPGSRICALVERDEQFSGLKVVGTTSGRRTPEADPLPYVLARARAEARP